MNKTLVSGRRALLLWCLALLLALQGFSAAAASLHCTGLQAAMLQLQAAMPTFDAAAAQASEVAPPCHEAVQDSVDVADASHAAVQPDASAAASDAQQHASGHSCGVCADCCLATPLPARTRWNAPLLAADTSPALPSLHWPHVLLAGIERPPRNVVLIG